MFHEERELITKLKGTNAHFTSLFDKHNDLDEKIAELQQLPTQEEQIKRANELEKEALQQYGIMPYVNGPQLYATKNGLANYGSYAFALVPKENIGWAK